MKNYRLIDLRSHYGYSQSDLSCLCGTRRETISDIENCKRSPSFSLAVKISYALTINDDFLFTLAYLFVDDVLRWVEQLEEVKKRLENEKSKC